MRRRPDSHRVVITGMGAISPLGQTVDELWAGLVAGRSGIAPITQFDASEFPTRFAGEVKDFDPTQWINPKEVRRMGRASQLAQATTYEALRDAGLEVPLPADLQDEMGVCVGTAMGPFDRIETELDIYAEKGWRSISPFSLAFGLTNMPAHHVSLVTQAKGPIATPVNACATGTQAIVEGAEYIRRGHAQLMIAGGVEGLVHVYGIAGFSAMRALSTRNEEPEKASRPFDKTRDGFILSEGCGLVVLESLEHAQARGARIYAEVLGGGSSSDAYHMVAPDPEGKGAYRAMKLALRDSGVEPNEVDYINAHGTSTPLNDAIETLAIKTLFGEQAYNIPISSTKSMIGHAMGSAGALEAIVCVKTLQTGMIHPTINYQTPDPDCDLDYVPNVARPAKVRVALSNSFGLGGNNACLLLGQYLNGSMA
jgi:3-oxoacyl-[acyl-carrier-protein] synthase II